MSDAVPPTPPPRNNNSLAETAADAVLRLLPLAAGQRLVVRAELNGTLLEVRLEGPVGAAAAALGGPGCEGARGAVMPPAWPLNEREEEVLQALARLEAAGDPAPEGKALAKMVGCGYDKPFMELLARMRAARLLGGEKGARGYPRGPAAPPRPAPADNPPGIPG